MDPNPPPPDIRKERFTWHEGDFTVILPNQDADTTSDDDADTSEDTEDNDA